jgi:predicted methyltransferase
MAARRALVWLAITACGGTTAPKATTTTPTAAAATTTTTVPPAAPTAEVTAAAPPPAPAASPTPRLPAPPCPTDRNRDPNQKPAHVVEHLELADAMTVVDLGSGSGYFLCHLSRAVGPRGHVIATEVDKGQVRTLQQRVAKEQLANVDVVLAPANDVGIAAGTADRILLVNVWHHLPDRKRYAAQIARALAAGGKLIVIDFPPARHRGSHGIAPDRVIAELAAGGIDAALVTEELEDQYMIVGTVHAPRRS